MLKRTQFLIVLLFVYCGNGAYSQRISELKCRETYSKITTAPLNSQSSEFNNFGVGKIATAPGEFPYMVAVGRRDGIEDDFLLKCGGVLIASQYVLTAAQCFGDSERPEFVRIGGGSISNRTVDNLSIIDTIIHPENNLGGFYNDIAILKLAVPSLQTPACLWQTQEINQPEVTAIGYGITSRAEYSPNNDLLKVNLQIISKDVCSKQFGKFRQLKDGIVDSQMCVGDESKLKDTCEGDGGGPLLVKIEDNGKEIPYVVGINSLGAPCGLGYPNVFTRVSSYLDWIESVVWPDV